MANKEECARVLKQIETYPEKHNQTTWGFHVKEDQPEKEAWIVNSHRAWYDGKECDTIACVAGWACYLNGYDFTDWGFVTDGTGAQHVSYVAREILGLTFSEADVLFYSGIREAKDMLQDLIDGNPIDHGTVCL